MASSNVLQAVRQHLLEHFSGYRHDEAQVTFLGATPMTVMRFVPPQLGPCDEDPGNADIVWYCSVGCSEFPMDPEAINPNPAGPRAEVMLGVRRGLDAVLRSLAVIASSPAIEGVVLREGFLLDLESPLWPGSAFTGVVLERGNVAPLAGDWGADVQFFRAVPVTQTEAAWVRLKGAAALREAWDEAGVDTFDPDRRAVNPR